MTDNRTTERVDHPPRVREAIDELMREKDAIDNRTTELLRKLLEECGVEWWETINHVNCIFTWWESPTFGIVHAMDNEDGETLYMACLNNCDFTPEQAIAATLGSGTLTAEQVREAAKSNSRQYESPVDDGVWIREYDWQAIADDMNERAGRTCKAIRDKSNTIVCSKCGGGGLTIPNKGQNALRNYCPNCGAKVMGV